MRRELSYSFEELPLVIENGFSAGLVNGSAEIAYYPDGEWFVSRIFLDGFKEVTATDDRASIWDRKPVELDEGSRIFQIINDRLENEWASRVFSKVEDAITDDRVSADESRWESRRDLMREAV